MTYSNPTLRCKMVDEASESAANPLLAGSAGRPHSKGNQTMKRGAKVKSEALPPGLQACSAGHPHLHQIALILCSKWLLQCRQLQAWPAPVKPQGKHASEQSPTWPAALGGSSGEVCIARKWCPTRSPTAAAHCREGSKSQGLSAARQREQGGKNGIAAISVERLDGLCAGSTASLEKGSEACLWAQWSPLCCWLAGPMHWVQSNPLTPEANLKFFGSTLRSPEKCGAPQHIPLQSTGHPQHHEDDLGRGRLHADSVCGAHVPEGKGGFRPPAMRCGRPRTCMACWLGSACRQFTVLGADATTWFWACRQHVGVLGKGKGPMHASSLQVLAASRVHCTGGTS